MKNKNNKNSKVIIYIVIFLVVIIGAMIFYNILSTGYTPENSTQESGKVTVAPDFTVKSWDKQDVSLSQFKGKPVVINFWATWCGFCLQEMPLFDEAYKKYNGRVEFMMLNLTDNDRETEEKVRDFIKEYKYSFPVYFDFEGEAAYKYSAFSIPLTVFVDKDGNVSDYHKGVINEKSLNDYIEKIL